MDNLMVTATELIAQETRRVEASSQNVANTATPGYKSLISFKQELTAQEPRHLGATPRMHGITISTDFSNGKLVHTGNPLDIAINGPGLFTLSTDDGVVYTRAGSFRRDADGRLVTGRGGYLQSAEGGDIVVQTSDWHVESDGTVIDGGAPVATVGIVEFEAGVNLVRKGNSLFAADPALAPPMEQRVVSSTLVQGFVEMANVAVGKDMIQVMESMRRIEAGQKVIHAYDDMMGNVLQRLGDM
ncbi:MAG: flagellar hook-basal body protein [Pseudomonas sp.]|uniref:flagellar hook-basal body protein n=1 Tax=Stenotrophomonas sp. TaxID=69392 RepID=UPI003D6C9888